LLVAAMAAVLCTIERTAHAVEAIDFSIPQQYVAVRALGMGNAFVALADDFNAILYNPAGLARLEAGQINMALDAGIDSKFLQLYKDINSTSSTDNVSDMTRLISSNYGNTYHARGGISGIWARPGWGLAIIPVDLSMNLGFHQLGGASVDLIATQDTTIAYGRGWDVKWFERDRMSLGVTAKAIYRGYFNKQIPAMDLAYNPNLLRAQDAREGLAVDMDFGMLYTRKISPESFMSWLRPSVGFTVRNLFDYGMATNFHLIDKQSENAPNLGRRFDVGTAWELPDFWIFKTRGLVDMRDMGAQNFTMRKGLHAGAEFLWKIRSWWQGGWRVGLNQGYFTAGFTGKFTVFNLDLATYAEEMGSSETPYASRRYVLRASTDF
jgi:hypothetical protein